VVWGRLSHAYGDADDLPDLLAQMAPDAPGEVWDELASRLCHQGTVYSASFAALPALEEAARGWRPAERVEPLMLAAHILASDDVEGSRDRHLAGLEPIVDSLRALALESVVSPGLERADFIYLAQSVLAFEGDSLWGQRLEELVSDAFSAVCPDCRAALTVELGEAGSFFAFDPWHHPDAEPYRSLISPSVELGEGARRLTEWALAAEQSEVAAQIPYLFGRARCPSCDTESPVPEAIAAHT
jgi:hypothetical protein